MNVRPATSADRDAIHELWQEFVTEVPEPEGFGPDSWETDWADIEKNMKDGAVFVAEDGGALLGFLEASSAEPDRWHVETVHVRPAHRREGVAKALLRACAESVRAAGAAYVSLEVLSSNLVGEAVWRRLGFEPVEVVMAQTLDSLETRLGDTAVGPSHASTHIQTDDRVAVERAVAQFVPRLDGAEVRDASGGWIRIMHEQLDADRNAHSRFARDISDRLGAVVVALAVEHAAVVRMRLYERGRMVDEYLSVPAYYENLDTSDELALAINPTLVARLTGGDREAVRRAAPTAALPGDLPPAEQAYRELARAMGLEVDG